jgi:hypothetical protein
MDTRTAQHAWLQYCGDRELSAVPTSDCIDGGAMSNTAMIPNMHFHTRKFNNAGG